MDIVKATFPNGLPTLDELKAFNNGKGVPPETAWIWGEDDEVLLYHTGRGLNCRGTDCLSCSSVESIC
jgi:hypothetical protein